MGRPDANLSRIHQLVSRLPGLASLPAGMRFLCEHENQSLAQVLVDYLNHQQPTRGNPLINQVYRVVSRLLQYGLTQVFGVRRLMQMDAIRLGAQLADQRADPRVRQKQAEMMFQAGYRSGLLVRSSAAVSSSEARGIFLRQVRGQSTHRPVAPAVEIFLSFAEQYP